MTFDPLVAIDNYLLEFLSGDATFPCILELLEGLGQHAQSPSRSKIPLSPQSPHNVLRSPQLRQRQYANESSSAFSSQTFSTRQLPPIYNPIFSQKVGVFARATVFRCVPEEVLQLEQYILSFFEMQFPDGLVSVQQSILNPFYANEALIASKFPDYYKHIPKKSLTYLTLLMESLFCVPSLLSRPFMALMTGDFFQPAHLTDIKLYYYNNITYLDLYYIKYYYEKVKLLPPEERFFAVFDANQTLNFAQMHALCLEVVALHPYFEFVNQFIYQNAFAYTAAARLFYDLDAAGRWYLSASYMGHSGVSVVSIFFDVQETTEITGYCGIFGYEQFYVLYCIYAKYAGNDITTYLSEVQLRTYNYFQFSQKAIYRIFYGSGRPLLESQFCYADFIVFAISDIVIDSSVAARYWFGVADVDEDGVLSSADLGYFIRDYRALWDRAGLEVSYYDVLRQMSDSVKFGVFFASGFSRNDIIRSRMHANFFGALFSLQKFQLFEQRDVYIANKSVYQSLGVMQVHSDSLVWRNFWEQAYNDLVDDE